MLQVRSVIFKKDHPSLSAHFPGNPVIPGVLILAEVIETISQSEPRLVSLLGAPNLKFHSPLRPEEVMTIRLEPQQIPSRKFICTTGSRIVATGAFSYQIRERSEEHVE